MSSFGVYNPKQRDMNKIILHIYGILSKIIIPIFFRAPLMTKDTKSFR